MPLSTDLLHEIFGYNIYPVCLLIKGKSMKCSNHTIYNLPTPRRGRAREQACLTYPTRRRKLIGLSLDSLLDFPDQTSLHMPLSPTRPYPMADSSIEISVVSYKKSVFYAVCAIAALANAVILFSNRTICDPPIPQKHPLSRRGEAREHTNV